MNERPERSGYARPRTAAGDGDATPQLLLMAATMAATTPQGLTPTGWALPATLTALQWRACGQALGQLEEAKQWWLGDWWNAGVAWGDGHAACEESGLVYGTAANAGRVATAIQFSRRRENLPFTHHVEVCRIEETDVQDRFLLWCEETIEATGKPRTTRELREAVSDYLDSVGWTAFERERRRWVEAYGYPTLANHHRDPHLLKWAKFSGRHVYIGRGSKWGNPFEIGTDGDRDYVIDSYALYYFPRKLSLADTLPELAGKVLECYCVPERCHGEVLIEMLQREAWELLDGYLRDSGGVHAD